MPSYDEEMNDLATPSSDHEEEGRYSGSSSCPLANIQEESGTTKFIESMKMMGLEILNMKEELGSMKKWGVIQMTSHNCNISWSSKMGVEEANIFGSVGLTLEKDEKKMVLCYLDMVHFTEIMGITPPEVIKSFTDASQTHYESEETLEERVCIKTQNSS